MKSANRRERVEEGETYTYGGIRELQVETKYKLGSFIKDSNVVLKITK